jgi:hypothetical protein
MKETKNNLSIDSTRRRFVAGLAAGGAISTLGLSGCSSMPNSSSSKPKNYNG